MFFPKRQLFCSILIFSFSLCTFASDLSQRYSLQPLGAENKNAEVAEITLIQFWASWCHSCRGLMWDLDELVGEQKVDYLAVSIDDSIQEASRHIAQHELKDKRVNRFWYDARQLMAEEFAVNTIPTVVILGKNSQELFRTSGHLNGSDLLKIKNVIAKAASQK